MGLGSPRRNLCFTSHGTCAMSSIIPSMPDIWLIGTWPEEEFAPLRSALEKKGYGVKPGPGEQVEVAEVITEDTALVILLQRLPEEDQTPALMLMREFNPDAQVAILSNVAQKENLLKAKKYGVNDFWLAPVDAEKIVPRIEKIVPPAPPEGAEGPPAEVRGEEGSPYVQVPINQILDGLVLAQPVEVRGAVMLHQGTQVTQAHVDRLSRWGVETITAMRADYEKLKAKKGAHAIAIPQKKEELWDQEPYRVGTELLPVGQMLDISDEHGHKLLGNLDDVSPGHLVVGFPPSERVGGRFQTGGHVNVNWQSRGAGYRFAATVEKATGSTLYLKHPAKLFKKQLRGAVREEVSFAHTYWLPPKAGEEKVELEALSTDISSGGMGFKSREKLEKNHEVMVNFTLEEGLAFPAQPAMVVRVQELRHDRKWKYSYGVVFSNMPEFTKERIMKYIFKLQREKQQVGVRGRRG